MKSNQLTWTYCVACCVRKLFVSLQNMKISNESHWGGKQPCDNLCLGSWWPYNINDWTSDKHVVINQKNRQDEEENTAKVSNRSSARQAEVD